MSQSKTISINGVQYDAHSGMPLETAVSDSATFAPSAQASRPVPVHAKGVHVKTQRSATLNRKFVKKTAVAPKTKASGSVKSMDVRRPAVIRARSPHISKFAPAAHVTPQVNPESKPALHPIVAKVQPAQPHKKKTPPPAHVIKEAAIADALSKAQTPKEHKKRGTHRRILNVASASLGLLLIAGYFTYINMPNLSVKVAAAQAGIDAKFPDYRPVGYRLNGPVAFREGEVTMEFTSNSGPQEFSLSQEKSSWDSSALLENYVDPNSNGHYATYNDAGLTVYTYGNSAAWVNGGILYTVDGTATLSNEQVRRIATSM